MSFIKGKTLIVTGGAKGIGAAIAMAFAERGANIVLNYRSSNPADIVAQIETHGVKCMPYQADVGDFEQAKGLVLAAKENFGSVDILVNNAGMARDNLLIRMSEADFDSVINANLKGSWNTIRHAAGIMMKQRSGSIINVASVVGLMGNMGQANYAASKGGVIALSKAIARELAPRGITCNAIAPGFIETDMTNILPEEIKEKYMDSIPLKRLGSADDIAHAAVFLAESTYTTGQVISINGGMYM